MRILALFFCLFFCLPVFAQKKPHVVTHQQEEQQNVPYTPDQLQVWYAWYNKNYFYGKLPEKVDIVWSTAPDLSEDLGDSQKLTDGVFLIRLNVHYNTCGVTALNTLLHEMVHVDLDGKEHSLDHGPMFHARIRKLVEDGAYDDLL